LKILEQVCVKFPKFSSDNHGLKHHNKLLDLSMMFRFAGLPNNSNLEMVEVENKRVEGDLVICLQLEDGSRLNGNFPPSANLREIITKLCPEKSSPDQKPVVVYMRSELHSEALDTTTLKSLGLSSGGRALLRLINTDPEALKVQANISAPLPQKPREKSPERPRQRSNVDQQPGTSSMVEAIKKVKQEVKQVEKVEESMEVEEEAPGAPQVQEQIQVDETPAEPEPEPIINILDDRGTIVFSLDSMQTSSVELPDSFFDLTENEVRKLYQELKIQAENNENRPLMTSALRKLEENKKILNQLSLYKSCAIRVQMPNRFVIQSKFSTVEKISDVIALVKRFLVNPDIDFHLCK
jgi:tether containing UBX domain for GLUT4